MMDLGSGVGKYNLSQFKEPSAIAQGGATMRGAFTGLGDKIMGAIAEPGLKREQETNNAKVQEFLTAYNDKQNPSNPIFGGLEGSQRALKLARILLPIAPEMSARYEKAGMDMERQEVGSKEKKEALGLSAEKKAKAQIIQKDLMDKYSIALDAFSQNPTDPKTQDTVRRSIADLRAIGVQVENPIDDRLREEANKALAGSRIESIAFEKEKELSDLKQAEQKRLDDLKKQESDDKKWSAEYALKIKEANRVAQAEANKADSPAKLNDLQAKATGFSDRMGKASGIMIDKGPQLSFVDKSILSAGLKPISDVGQSYYYALADFARAQLRQESGAAIGQEEFAGAFDQYGIKLLDSPESIKQKESGLIDAVKNMRTVAGPQKQLNSIPVMVPSKTGSKRIIK